MDRHVRPFVISSQIRPKVWPQNGIVLHAPFFHADPEQYTVIIKPEQERDRAPLWPESLWCDLASGDILVTGVRHGTSTASTVRSSIKGRITHAATVVLCALPSLSRVCRSFRSGL